MTDKAGHRQLLQKAFMEVKRLKQELREARETRVEEVAVIGMGCRFPGNVHNPEDFWDLLHRGVDAIEEVPPERWDLEAYYHPDPDVPGKIYCRHGGWLRNVDRFDPEFFGIAPLEAAAMDPQQRILLEVTWESLEHAGIVPGSIDGSQTAVYMGLFMNDYSAQRVYSPNPQHTDAYNVLNGLRGLIAGRVAYFLGAHGPTMQLDTACSSSLLAIHLAVKSLREKECNLALAGGVNLILSPENSIGLCRLKAMSPEGRCKTFDASADGYVRGEGAGVVILKRLNDAVADGNKVLAVVRGSAVNHDGKSNGLTAPNGMAQQAVIRQALKDARVPANAVQYVEAHGTGTPLGDPIEVSALEQVLCRNRTSENPLYMGSAKTNFGHLESAAGVAAFIKTVLALREKTIPAHLHFHKPSPYIDWNAPLVVPVENTPWPEQSGGRLAGISSFGMSGTNVHLIVQEAPDQANPEPVLQMPSDVLLTLAARDESALREMAASYADLIGASNESDFDDLLGDEGGSYTLEEIGYTAQMSRTHFNQRLALVASSEADAQEQLNQFARGRDHSSVIAGYTKKSSAALKTAFLFTGQGSQYHGMGRELYESQTVFREAIDQCAEILDPILPIPLTQLLFQSDELDETVFTQPALFSIGYALAQLWQSWGIVPAAVMGHSVGEYVAACVAGVFTLEDGLRIIAERGRLMHALPRDGAMASIALPAKEVEALLVGSGHVSIAAYNGPRQTVISGDEAEVLAILAKLDEKVKRTQLKVSHAFHSPMMESILIPFGEVVASANIKYPRIPVISNLTGKPVKMEMLDKDYWVDHIREAVRFNQSMTTLEEMGVDVFLELGPEPILLGMGRQCVKKDVQLWLPSLRKRKPDAQQILESLGHLYVNGAPIDWDGYHKHHRPNLVPAPTYPFQRQHCWTTPPAARQSDYSFPGRRVPMPRQNNELFELTISKDEPAFLKEHQIFDRIIVPASMYLSIVMTAARELSGNPFCVVEEINFTRALVLPEDGDCTLQLILDMVSEGSYEFRVLALAEDGRAHDPEDWNQHATGKVSMRREWPDSAPDDTLLADEEPELIAADEFDAQWGSAYYRGKAFKWLGNISRYHSGAWGNLRELGPGEDMSAYVLHPGMVDSVFQMLLACYPDAASLIDPNEPLVPVSIDKVLVYAPPKGGALRCFAQLTGENNGKQGLKGDLLLVGEGGEVRAEIRGLQVRRIKYTDLVSRRAHAPLYEVAWRPSPRLHHADQQLQGTWIVLAGYDGVGDRIAGEIRSRGVNCVVIRPRNDGVEKEGNLYLHPMDSQGFEIINGYQPNGIVFAWGLSPEDEESSQDREYRMRRSTGSLLHAVRALAAGGHTGTRLLVLTRGAHGPSRSFDTSQASLWGMCQTIALEHPEMRPTQVDLDPDKEWPLGQVLDDLLETNHEVSISYRGDKRYVARLSPVTLAGKRIELHPDGAYLIAGGLGGLGLVVAQHLVTLGARHLILCGRRTPSDTAREAIATMEARGARVITAQIDITKREEVASLFNRTGIEMPSLRGIIQAAGVLDDGLIANMHYDRFRDALLPKVSGTWYLHELSSHQALDFFVCFSSVASLLGSAGQANYAAGNAYQDALMRYRREQGLPGLSINWGPWSGAGMAANLDEKSRERMQRQGFKSLDGREGCRILDLLLGSPLASVGVLPIDWDRYLGQLPTTYGTAFFEEIGKPREAQDTWTNLTDRLQQSDLAHRKRILDEGLRIAIAGVLGIADPSAVKPSENLFDMGMDSLTAVELKNRLEKALGRSVRATLVFDYPSLEAIEKFLIEKMLSRLFRPDGSMEITIDTLDKEKSKTIEEEIEDFDALSDEDAEALLFQELENLDY